ncbi:T9SS-dependent M36 family metallopeptidase [Pontibacter sp. MBLB2868]|uniref:T9SS-dependent M36 family metallopeptidase n=1 Tax=Pontibacter sp. MBLB2868 TaxID=3451555 RepID=UPI003F755FFF
MGKNLRVYTRLAIVVAMLFGCTVTYGQGTGRSEKKEVPQAALDHIKKNKQKLGLEDADIAELELSSATESKKSGMKHYYLKQLYQGIEIHGALTNISLDKDDKVVTMGNRLNAKVSKKVKDNQVSLDAQSAVAAAARYLNTSLKEQLTVKEKGSGRNREVLFSTGGISLEPIPAKLVYQPMADGSLRLAWEVSIYELDAQNWWNIRLDASNGEVLDKDNMVVHCQFENNGVNGSFLHDSHSHNLISPNVASPATAVSVAEVTGFNVFAMPHESPIHGDRSIISTSAANQSASPYGWNIETITRGNNVFAYEDPNNNNSYLNNYSPDGGQTSNFNFQIDFTKEPVNSRDAAITNLFYWNNLVHDVWYQYGFDETSGSFQLNNYGKGGAAGDPVLAEAQDSRNIATTRNNANFSTPRDGFAPRMQMYLWSAKTDPEAFTVVSPASVAGTYPIAGASFGPKLSPTPITGKLVLAQDNVSNEGCNAFTNASDISGNIAVVYRGTCAFTIKVQNAQAAGAVAVVVINSVSGAPISMGGTPTEPINIPAVMVSDVTGAKIREQLNAGIEVVVSLKDFGNPEMDGDFDNGIIVHEYGHGISNRLTGGPDASSCLASALQYPNGDIIYTEQMGEGWSDWFGLMMTMKPGDTRTKVRGIGTYVSNQQTDGGGIRPAPYSTSFSVNGFTYAATNNPAITAPHGVGFVWATMLWDMTWDMVDKYGFDEDLYNGKGGNNMAMQLVIDGLKMQPCRPGFVDGRDAILLADQALYNGANQELIWRAFAKRGLGFSAKQGSNLSRFDQEEAYDVPPMYACEKPVVEAVAMSSVYTGGVVTNIYLGYGPQSVKLKATGDVTNIYKWSGPGATELNSTTAAEPVFTPTKAGSYTFTVTALNEFKCKRQATITITVVDVRCGDKKKRDKVMVCVDGENNCADPRAVDAMLTKAGGKLGDCSLNMSVASASIAASGLVKEEDTEFIQSYPNPFSESTTISFKAKETGYTLLKVYDITGREVETLFEGNADSGKTYSYSFKGTNKKSGVYIYRIINGSVSRSGTMLLVK